MFPGGALGLLVARWDLHALVLSDDAGIARAARVALDGRVLVFTLALALGTGLLFGLAPLLRLNAESWRTRSPSGDERSGVGWRSVQAKAVY